MAAYLAGRDDALQRRVAKAIGLRREVVMSELDGMAAMQRPEHTAAVHIIITVCAKSPRNIP